MDRRIIDISMPLENGVKSDPDMFRPRIEYFTHKDTFADLAAFFPGLQSGSMPDGWSWDAPFIHTKEKYLRSGEASLIWEGHKVGREIGYCHLEKLHNLEALPPDGFAVCCFPVKIKGASAGWTRAVALIDD